MEKSELLDFINDFLSIREIAQKKNKSYSTIRYWLDFYKLKTKIKEKSKYFCINCGEISEDKFYKKKNRCKVCHNNKIKEYILESKKKAVYYKGGECSKCGYNKNYAALDFHHLDPNNKDINWKTSRVWKWEKLKFELDKCILVCKNCHAEIHYPNKNM